MPEFFVSFAVIDKASPMAVGNVLGSNMAFQHIIGNANWFVIKSNLSKSKICRL